MTFLPSDAEAWNSTQIEIEYQLLGRYGSAFYGWRVTQSDWRPTSTSSRFWVGPNRQPADSRPALTIAH